MGQHAFSAPVISIHSPRMGRDGVELVHEGRRLVDFNPLSPHGERPPT